MGSLIMLIINAQWPPPCAKYDLFKTSEHEHLLKC